MKNTDRIIVNRTMAAPGLLVFLCMFGLTVLTPKYADDFAYSFSFATDTRITSVLQIFPSMSVHRELLNGRVVPHFLVQLLLMLPRVLFSLLNALNACLLIVLVSRYLEAKAEWHKSCNLIAGAFAVWVFSPSFGENYLWLDGAVNYSWAISILMLFLLPYSSAWLGQGNESRKGKTILHAILALFAGAWSENGSLVFLLLAACMLVLIWMRDRRLPRDLLVSLIFASIGYLFLMSAPATAGRAAETTSTLGTNIRNILIATQKYLLWLYLTAAVLMALCVLWHGRKERVVFAGLLLVGGVVSLGCFAFAAYFVERHFSITVFLTVLACSILVDELFCLQKPEMNVTLVSCLTIVFLFRFGIGLLDIFNAHRAEVEREQLIQESILHGEKTATLKNHYVATRYALPFILDAPDDWVNVTVASYYELETVYGMDPAES